MPGEEAGRLERARISLEGLSVGDAFGESYFIDPGTVLQVIEARQLSPPPWHYTDDTEMTLSIVSDLQQHGGIEQDSLAQSFADRYDESRGYGPAMHGLLRRIGRGEPWSQAAGNMFEGQGSFGNGAAMRVAPLGAYFADDMEAVVEQARRSAEVTHAHPDGIAGAIAVAAALAWRLRGSEPTPIGEDFLNMILP